MQESTNVVIAVGNSPGKGRGVFARERIGEGQVIDTGPVVIVPPNEIGWLKKTSLANYYFVWGTEGDAAALLLSSCSLCNHSDQANASFTLNATTLTIAFVARRDIEPGEEITIDYRQEDVVPRGG